MLSQTDFVGCSSLHECVIEAIAEHEHVPMPVAVVIGENLLTSKEGLVCLHKMVLEDIEHAMQCQDRDRVHKLAKTYKVVSEKHPLPPTSQRRH